MKNHPNARRPGETLEKYHSRLKAERQVLKAHLKGRMVWQATGYWAGTDYKPGQGTYRKEATQ